MGSSSDNRKAHLSRDKQGIYCEFSRLATDVWMMIVLMMRIAETDVTGLKRVNHDDGDDDDDC